MFIVIYYFLGKAAEIVKKNPNWHVSTIIEFNTNNLVQSLCDEPKPLRTYSVREILEET